MNALAERLRAIAGRQPARRRLIKEQRKRGGRRADSKSMKGRLKDLAFRERVAAGQRTAALKRQRAAA